MNKSLIYCIASLLILLGSGSCKKDKDFKDGNACLKLSADTILFDTVFTKLDPNTSPKSINKQFIVRNPYNEDVKTSVFLAGGNTSQFRLNVDGEPGTAFHDVLIRAKDSIYVFVELYALPNGGTGKLIINDSILFQTGDCKQQLQLRAWGQDAHFFNDSILECNTVWDDASKPYVIYNSILVPAGCTFTIRPGVHVYSSPGSYIYVQGTLKIEGNPQDRVVLQGDRLEKSYADQPGQWGGIWILRDSKENSIDFALIKNAYIGITVDSLPPGGINAPVPNLVINHTIVQTMTAIGLYGKTAVIDATNCAFVNCGQLTFFGRYGGRYNFKHCTFASYNNFLPRDKPSFAMFSRERDQYGTIIGVFPIGFRVVNSIIYGSNKEEILLDIDNAHVIAGGWQVFDRMVVKTELGQFVNVPDTHLRLDPKFKKYSELDFSLDTLSPAKNYGKQIGVNDDILGKNRDSAPDVGAYERIE